MSIAEHAALENPRRKTAGIAPRSLVTRAEQSIPFAIFLVCLAYLCLFLWYSSIELDEGIVLREAERIQDGQLPYRDFFSFYTPGSFYLIALLFRLFGDSFVVARISIAVVGALCSVVTYAVARRACSCGTAIFCALLATTTGAAFRFLVLHNPYSTLFSCLALYAGVRFVETHGKFWVFSAGSLACLTFLIEQSKGAGLFAGLILGLILVRVASAILFRMPEMFMLMLGFGWPLAVTFAYFGAHDAISTMLQSWLWPLEHYAQVNRVPYGYQNWSEGTRNLIFHSGPLWLRAIKILTVSPGIVVPVLPLISLGVLVHLVWRARSKRPPSPYFAYYTLTCSVCTGLLTSVIVVRPDSLHFMYLAPVWYVVLAWVLGARGVPSGLLHRARPYLTLYVGTAFGMLAMASLLPATGARYMIATRRGIVKTSAPDTVIPYVQAHVAADGELLVYPYRPLYNYLTGTRSPSHYDFFQAGMNTPQQAQEIIGLLESGKSVPVLLEPWFVKTIPHSWAKTPWRAVATDPVADYIARNYRVCAMLNSPEGLRFQAMVPNSAACLKK